MIKKQTNITKNKLTIKNIKHTSKKYKICKLYIKTTLNNTFITLTDLKGNVFLFYSTGKLGFKGAKRSTSYAAESVLSYIIKNCMSLGIKGLFLYINGINNIINTSINKFKSYKIRIFRINNYTPINFNGCRAPKTRRV
jgi:small subunit ribosomal protein S11